ncbi:hypothetical protein FQA39_LY11907 [Lamprigera yunnana]|nr:hypothetical protein FQA39_LY11907 [Lamprigera yunnana]
MRNAPGPDNVYMEVLKLINNENFDILVNLLIQKHFARSVSTESTEIAVNSEESQDTNAIASISNILKHQHVLVPPPNSTSDKSETSNNTLKKLNAGECTGGERKKKGNSKRYIASVVNNKVILLDWYSEEPYLDDPDNFKVLYSLRNIKFHKGKISTGYITFAPDQGKSEIALNHIIIFKIEKGSALVSQQLVSTIMSVGMSFYIPLGVAYKIKNSSDSLPLVLYFEKVPMPNVKKKLFRRPSNLLPRQTLKEYLLQVDQSLVTSTPLNDLAIINKNSVLKLTPIAKDRNNTISSQTIHNPNRLSKTKTCGNKKTHVIKKELRKSKRKLQINDSKKENHSCKAHVTDNELDGIEPLNKTIKQPIKIKTKTRSLLERDIQTNNSLKECQSLNKPDSQYQEDLQINNSVDAQRGQVIVNDQLLNTLLADLDAFAKVNSTVTANSSTQSDREQNSSKLTTVNIKVHTNDTNLEKTNTTNSLLHGSYYNGGRILRSASRINNTLITDGVDSKLKKPTTRTKSNSKVAFAKKTSGVIENALVKNSDLSANENKRKISEENKSNHTVENKINLSTRSSSRRKAVNEINKSINIESIAEEDSNDENYVRSVVDNSNTVPIMLEESKAEKTLHYRTNVKKKKHNKSEHTESDETIFGTQSTTKQKSHSKKRTTKVFKNTSVNDVSTILQQYIVNRASGFVEIQKQKSLASDSKERLRGDGRLRRNVNPPKAYIQATFFSVNDLKKSQSLSNRKTKNGKNKSKSTLTENKMKSVLHPSATEILPQKLICEQLFYAKRFIECHPLTESTESEVHLEESQATIPSMSKQHVITPLLNVTPDESGPSQTSNFDELDMGEYTKKEKKGKYKQIVQGVVNNEVIFLDWYCHEPYLGDAQDFQVLYGMTNLKSHMGKCSSGYITFGPCQEKSQIPRNHVITFKVDKGTALVSQQLVSSVMNVNTSFHIPLGVPYKIKNLSDSEPLILYFIKISNL